MKFFSLNKSALANKIFAASKVSNADDKELKIDKFSDGELLPIFQRTIRGEDIFIICDGNSSEDIMKLLLTLDACKRSGAKETNVIYPFTHAPLNKGLFKDMLRVIGAKSLITTRVDNEIEGFYTFSLGENTQESFTEYINLFDKRLDIQGELFYSLNKTPLANRIFNAIQYYNGTDDYFEINRSPEGVYSPMFTNNLKDKEVFIVADGHHVEEIMKLLASVREAKLRGASSITVIYPYAPYSRQDKNDHVRSSIGAKMLADMLQCAGMTRMITVELHAGAIQGFYDVPIIHLNGNNILRKPIKELNLSDLTFCAPDHGATKRNQDCAKTFSDYTNAVIDKRRLKPNEVAFMELIGDVKGRNVVLVDDMGDTLGTLCKAASLLLEKGALSVRGVLTHPVLSGKALENLYSSALTELIVSDTVQGIDEKTEIYRAMVGDDENRPKLKVESSAEFLANSIDRLIKHESINEINAVA